MFQPSLSIQFAIQVITILSILISLFFLIKLRMVEKHSSFKVKLESLVFAVIFLQTFELICRVSTKVEFIRNFHDFFYFFILLVGYLCFDLVYSLLFKYSRLYNTIRYILFLGTIFMAFLCVKYEIREFFKASDIFGYVTEFKGNPLAKISRFWIGFCFTLAVLLFYIEFFRKSRLGQDFKYFFLGLLITGGLGFFGQILLPVLFNFEIPLISISVPIFIYFSYSLLSNNILVKLNLRESSSTIFDSVNAYVAFVDNAFILRFANKNFFSAFGSLSVGDSLESRSEFSLILSELRSNKIQDFNVIHLNLGDTHLGFRLSPIFENSHVKGFFLIGINVSDMVDQLNKSKVSVQQILEYSKNQKSYVFEYFPEKGNFEVSPRLAVYLNLDFHEINPKRLLLYLRKKLFQSDLNKIINYLKNPDKSEEMIICYKDEYSGVYRFKVNSYENEFSNQFIFFLVEENQFEEMKNWYKQDISWIISHVFRKNVANALGLLAFLRENDEQKSNPIFTDQELIKLINNEIEELDQNLISYSKLK